MILFTEAHVITSSKRGTLNGVPVGDMECQCSRASAGSFHRRSDPIAVLDDVLAA
jgi:hypothetical protein